ncbi:HypC/HybG/HupF family hydrogenase formation chaperone [Parabacteroides pacaensis]|uniref:HypC/HybG/HupF family hydrogenase formation chaperone n=1 Tax=Parabacteroides pacaensis TaxID=2086575 RepID=UPI000D103F07|nr:HypC/HybG/HupF family hydrogenase formation chaperone [Parabacteroides pacaensis]
MCLAVPGKILSIDDSLPEIKMAKVDFGGIVRNICIQWVDATIHDYILAHAGMAISVINEEEAVETLRLLEEMAKDCEE